MQQERVEALFYLRVWRKTWTAPRSQSYEYRGKEGRDTQCLQINVNKPLRSVHTDLLTPLGGVGKGNSCAYPLLATGRPSGFEMEPCGSRGKKN